MPKKHAIIFLAALIVMGILLGFVATSANGRAYNLASRFDELYNSYTALQAENNMLQDLIESLHQEAINIVDTANLPVQEDSLKQHPIDIFFIEMAQELVPTSTSDMVRYSVIVRAAWKAEIDNFYEILINQTQSEFVREWLYNERHYYTEYLRNRAELEALRHDGPYAFFDDGSLHVYSSMRRIERVSLMAEGYREKALELFDRLYEMGMNPQFIFDEEDYRKEIQQEFPHLWERAFGAA